MFTSSKDPELAELQWLITKDGGCELDDVPIQGSSTVHLLYLSFTLLKIFTKKTIVKLLDNSKFDCIFTDGSKMSISMNKYSYLFHGGTWYDIKANAIPIDPTQRNMYTTIKKLYTDPSAKYPNFDFRNHYLQKELGPIYENVTTWKEFADTLYKMYDKTELCRKIAPWYTYAIADLTQDRMLPEIWSIDISNLPTISFTSSTLSYNGSKGGGCNGSGCNSHNKTRKRRSSYRSLNQNYIILSPSELYSKSI
jgi:hypothetical protein